MIVSTIKTPRITPHLLTLQQLLDGVVYDVPNRSVLAITSKIVSLCEGAVIPIAGTNKDDLIKAEAQYYLPESERMYGINFTVAQHTLIPNAGIDESNAGNVYILWPKNPQITANVVRKYLVDRFGNKDIGVIITDSTCRPMRRGVSGIAIAYSGFKPLRNYVGKPDLFGRPFSVSQSDIVGGLASSAVLAMGEGAESTPLALLQDLSFVDFTNANPTDEELASLRISLDEDLFAPFLNKVAWITGKKGSAHGRS